MDIGTTLGVTPLPARENGRGGEAMTVADALSLAIQFGSFVITLLSLVVALVLALTRK